MTERLKELRKKLKLSQGEFGAKIGLSTSGVGEIERGTNKLSERNFAAICREYNVNPQWLRYGEGEMFSEPKDGLTKLQEEYDLNEGDMAIIKSFLELPPEMRQMVLEFGRNLSKNLSSQLGIFADKTDAELTVAEKRRIVNEELDAEEKGRTSAVFTGTSGMRKSRNFS